VSSSEAVSSRLMNALQVAHEAGTLVFLGGDKYAVRVERTDGGRSCSVVRSGDTEQMWSWLNGVQRGATLPDSMDGAIRRDGWWSTGGVDAAVDRMAKAKADTAAFRRLVLDPPLADAIRVQILAGMEQRGLNFKELAALIGKGDQSVRDALLFGGPNPRIGNLALFDLMLRELGLPVQINRQAVGPDVDVVSALSGARFEPSGVTRMRALVIAAERRLIDGVSPTGLQRARRSREFTISVAGHEVVRPRGTLVHWLRGLADGAGDVPAMEALTLA
jgi:hypothetical protein